MLRLISSDVQELIRFYLPLLTFFNLFTFLNPKRMFQQWDEQRDYLRHEWGINQFVASILILYNLVAQLVGSGMALAQFRSTIACGILFSVVVLQVRHRSLNS